MALTYLSSVDVFFYHHASLSSPFSDTTLNFFLFRTLIPFRTVFFTSFDHSVIWIIFSIFLETEFVSFEFVPFEFASDRYRDRYLRPCFTSVYTYFQQHLRVEWKMLKRYLLLKSINFRVDPSRLMGLFTPSPHSSIAVTPFIVLLLGWIVNRQRNNFYCC